MALRTVGAKLVADVAEFEAGMAVAEEATNSLADELDKTGRTAKQAAEDLDKVSVTAVIAGREQETFGRSALTAAGHMEKLDREIKATERELQLLAVSFAEAGTAADRLDLSKAIRKSQADLRSLNKSKSLIKDLVPSDADAKQAGESFSKTFSKGFSGLGGELIPALVIAAVAAAPAIGAVISGAVVGGVGIGGIVGGLLLTKSDPRVASALTAFTGQLKAKLSADAGPFVNVWLAGIRTISGALDSIDFKALFSDAAKQAGPLIHGIAVAVEGLGHGITDLIHNAGPAVAAIGDGIGQLGQTIGNGLAELSSNGKQGADALRELFAVINIGLESTFGLIDALTKIYGVMREIGGPGVADAFRAVGDLQTPVAGLVKSTFEQASATKLATASIDQYGHATLTAGAALESFTTKVDDLAAAGRNLFDSTTNVAQSTADFEKSLKANGKTLDENTQKGRNNRNALSSVANSLVSAYDGFVKVNGEGVKSNAIAAQNRDKFIALAMQLGKTKSQAEALATQFGLIPAKKTTTFTANTHDAEARAVALREKINAISGKTVTITIAQAYKTFGKPATVVSPYAYRGYASGGPITGAGPKGIDSEVRMLAPGEHVWTAAEVDAAGGQQAMTALRAAVLSHGSASPAPRMMPAAGGGAQKVIVESRSIVDFANADSVMGSALIKLWRTNSGIRTTTVKALGLKAAA